MKIKVKKIKEPGDFPYNQYTVKVGEHKFEATVYENSDAHLFTYISGDVHTYDYDTTLDDLIENADEMASYYHNLHDFLSEVRYLHGEKK